MISQTKYVSSQEVLSLVGDMFYSTGWREDGKRYLGEGIMEMGLNWSTKVDITPEDDLLQVVNHRVEMPCEIEEVLQVYYQGERVPINRDVSMLGLTSDDFVYADGGEIFYTIDYPFIKTSFEEGEIKVVSKHFRLDKDGFIWIPDNTMYKHALKWWVVHHLILSGFKTKADVTWEKAEIQFGKYQRVARSQLKRMNKERRMQFSRMWTSRNLSYNDGRVTT